MKILFLVPLIAISFLFNQKDKDKPTINWMTIEEAYELQRTADEPKKILVDLYTDWCGWCKVMDKKTFTHPYIIKLVNKNYYPVKLNAEQKEPITIGENTFEFRKSASGRGGMNEFAYLIGKVQNKPPSFPTIIYLDENFKNLSPVPGYMTPEKIEPILKYFAEDYHKTTKWPTYQKTFKSKIKKEAVEK